MPPPLPCARVGIVPIAAAKPRPLSVSIETLLMERCYALVTSHAGPMSMSALGGDEHVKSLWEEIQLRSGPGKLKHFIQSIPMFIVEHDGSDDVISIAQSHD